MRKFLIIGVVVIAAAVGGYYANQEFNAGSGSDVLAYVPADSIAYVGQLEPYPIDEFIQGQKDYSAVLVAEIDINIKDSHYSEEEKFFMSLEKSYFKSLADPATFRKTFGLPEKLKMISYFVGVIPVIRYEIIDEKALWSLLDNAEQESGFQHKEQTIDKLKYRVYEWSATDKINLNLLVTYENGWATWAISYDKVDAEILKLVLGQAKPEKSLANTSILADMKKKHGFIDSTIGYISNQELITGVTTTDGNNLARMVTQINQIEGDNEFAEIQTPECQKEYASIAANWPQFVIGVRKQDIERGYFEIAFALESKNKKVLDALKSMQGFLPDYIEETGVFGMGVGVDTTNLVAAYDAIRKDLLATPYKCKSLAKIQDGINQSNPAALGMATAMVNGIRGAAFGIDDIKLSKNASDNLVIDDLQAIASVSADDPNVLFNMARGFLPPPANQIVLPEDGSALDLTTIMPFPPEVRIKPMMKIQGKHLIIYSGKTGENLVSKLPAELNASGFYIFKADYSKLIELIKPFVEEEHDLKEGLDMLEAMKMKIYLLLQVKDESIEIFEKAEMKLEKAS